MRVELGVNVDLTGRFTPVEEEVGRVVEMGFEWLYCDGGVCNMPEENFERVRKAIESAGAKVWSVHSTALLPKLGEPASAILGRHGEIVERTAALMSHCLTHHPGQWADSGLDFFDEAGIQRVLGTLPPGYAHRVHVEVLQGIAREAERYGIEPTIENLVPGFGGVDYYRLEKLIALADEAGVGICFDIGHYRVHQPDPVEGLLAIGGRLKETHLNDSLGEIGEGVPANDIHMPAGLGIINWPEVIYALRAIGYERPVIFEQGGPCHAGFDRLKLSEATVRNWRLFEELIERHEPLRRMLEAKFPA